MSFRKCIDDGVAAGELSSEKAEEIKNLFGDLEVQYNKQMGFAAASSKAALDTSAAIKKVSKEKKRRAMLQAKTWTKIRMHMDTFVTAVTGEQDKYKATFDIFEQSVTSRFNSVAQVQSAIRSRATSKMDQFLGTFKRNIIGETREKAKLENVISEIFKPGSTDDVSARQMAEAWAEAAEYLRLRFNAAGGAIPKRKDWGMPQFHNSVAVAAAGFTSWRDTILPKLDVNKMIDEQTGLPFSPQKLELVLKDVFETIRTNGQNKNKPGSFAGNQSFASRHQDHRFLVFKDADNWMKYQEAFGNPNAFDVMMAHIDNMSRDIALMEVMGPDPKTT